MRPVRGRAAGGSISALNPVRVFQLLFKLFLPYCGVLLLTLAGGFYALWGAGQFRSELGIEVSQERSVASWAIFLSTGRSRIPQRGDWRP